MGSVEKSRNVKCRKSGHKLPRRVSEMSKEVLEATLRKKKECNAKALQIVESLLEDTVSEEWFLENLKFISESHFEDVIEERAISMNCGYPLCTKKLKNIPSQQYHISAKLNKVYDITERKNFCSNQCYKASRYLKNQLLTSPLWMREKEEIPEFKLLPVELSSGGVGEEVDIGLSNSLKVELKQLHKEGKNNTFTSISQFTRDSLSKLAADIDKAERKERKLRTENSVDKEKPRGVKLQENNISIGDSSEKNIEEKLDSQNDETGTTYKPENYQEKEVCVQNVDNIAIEISKKVKASLHEYEEKSERENNRVPKSYESEKNTTIANSLKSDDTDLKKKAEIKETKSDDTDVKNKAEIKETLCFDNGKQIKPKKIKDTKKKVKDNMDNLDIPPVPSAVIHIEKCLHEWFTVESLCFLLGEDKVKELVSEKGECIKEYYKVVHNATWDPKTHEQYMAICRRLNLMEIEDSLYDNQHLVAAKPLPDYTAVKDEGRKMDLKVRAYYQGKTVYENIESESISETTNDTTPVLPLVDLHAQKALRRRIVLDRLNRVLPDLLRTFDLSSRDVTGDVRSLITTFTLGAHNITFKPVEWSLIGLIIIKMLSIKDTRLRILLDSEKVIKYTTLMLLSFQQDGGYLDRLMAWITDIDNLLHKQ